MSEANLSGECPSVQQAEFTHIQVVVIKPNGFIHSEAFAEIAEVLCAGLCALGASANVVENQIVAGAANIILGWHLLTEPQLQALPPGCILYNLEQMDEKNQALMTRLVRMADRCEVWDYSLRNIQFLYQAGFSATLRHVPIGTMPGMERIHSQQKQDIDVLFYGSVNPRRAKVLEEIQQLGLNVKTLFGVYGAERDAYIARAKVVLNLHYYDSNIFEMVRVSYLWSNRKAVVAECNLTTELEEGLEVAASFVPYAKLAAACEELVLNPAKRHALEQRAFEVMSSRDEVTILRCVLAGEAEVPAPGHEQQAPANPTISLVVNTYNEETNLQGLIDSCPGVDEILIADMESTDKTLDIARSNGAKVVNIPFTGTRCCEVARQTALDSASSEWHLLMDGDERISPGGMDRLKQIIANAPADVGAFSLARHTYLGAIRVHASGWETRYERHPRLLRRGRVQWPTTIHSVPKIDGKVEEIAEDAVWMIHYNFTDLEQFIEKTNRYSTIESRELLEAGKPVSAMTGLSEGLEELVRRYSPEQDGALSFAMSFGILAYKVFNHVKAAEASGWPMERLPSQAALARGVEAFAQELMSEMLTVRPLGAGTGKYPVSLIIPVFNKVEYTRQCVDALRQNTPDNLYEMVFVDNASTDGTAGFLSGLSRNVKVVTNQQNLGFVDACNLGAAAAQGKYLLFLNNDTTPQPGWLQELLKMVESDSNIGAVGAKLVYPDGRLQEAGGMIFQDGSGWNFGRFGNPQDGIFSKPCEVDYCSGAALLVRHDAFKQLGGFDQRYAPAYYEDTDLCFGIRSLGMKVMYCPTSVVTHHEGITAGTDLNSGFKRYQSINREKFVAKWREVLTMQDPAPAMTGKVPTTSDRARLSAKSAAKSPAIVPEENIVPAEEPVASLPPAKPDAPHILIIDPLMPMFDRAAGSLRLFRIIQLFRVLGCHVTFVARNGSAEPRYQAELEALGVVVYAGDREKMLQTGYITSFPYVDLYKILNERPCQLVWLSFWYIAEQYIQEIRKFSPDTTVLVDTVDVHFLRETRQAELTKDRKAMKQAQMTRDRELAIYGKADMVVTVTENDADVLRKNGLTVPTAIVPTVHAACEGSPAWSQRKDLLFVGNFNHPPNVDAVLWFCREIMPHVRGGLPGVKLNIVGGNPPAEITALAGPDVVVKGWVPETGSHINAARVSVAPLRVGAGMKGKVGEALAHGLPVVTTSIGAEGMELKNGEHVIIADDSREFANAIIKLYQDQALWEHISLAGQELVEERFGLKAVMHMLGNLLMEAGKVSAAR